MTWYQFYLPASIPQWEIFFGIVFVIIGYIEKKEKWTLAGWIILIVTGITSLAFNLFGGIVIQPTGNISASTVAELIATGWQSAIGGILASMVLVFQRLKKRHYNMLAILTAIYFMLVFFQFNQLMRSESKTNKAMKQTEQNK